MNIKYMQIKALAANEIFSKKRRVYKSTLALYSIYLFYILDGFISLYEVYPIN